MTRKPTHSERMKIMSINVEWDMIASIEKLVAENKFQSKCEVIRTCIRNWLPKILEQDEIITKYNTLHQFNGTHDDAVRVPIDPKTNSFREYKIIKRLD